MPPVYSRILQQTTWARILRQVAPNAENAASRRTFRPDWRLSSSLAASRTTQSSAARRTTANCLSKSGKTASRSTRPFHRTSRLRDAQSTPKNAQAQEPHGLTARLRKLSREYGWAALGVYLGLTVIDFPFCFLLVRSVGTERIGAIEHVIVSNVSKLIPQSARDRWREYRGALKEAEKEDMGNNDISEHVEMAGWGVEEAERRHNAEASLGTQLALAYAVHKSFIFLRVPLTAAITPKVVKVLRSWGWNIGKRPAKR
ncbi:hypothetical protein GGR52DRAFT_128425 [Hypoxylon sp. FL1284]|nr:hypothetical protein GGR52DRAFT_128425 [Hypoxylon sp. FL1284]